MKRSIYLLFLFPLFLNAQNEKPAKWRFNFSYQFESAGAFKADDSNKWNFFQVERQAGNGHSVQLGFERKFSKTIGLQSNLNYSNRNNTIGTGINSVLIDCLLPCDGVLLEHQISFSNLELDLAFFSEQYFGRLGILASFGFGGGYYFISQTKTIDVNQFSFNLGETINISDDLSPERTTIFGKMHVSFFYDYSESVRLFLRPTFKFDFTRTKSELLYNRFYAFGGAFGISIKI